LCKPFQNRRKSGQKFGVIFISEKFSICLGSASAPSMNTAKRNRPTTIPAARKLSPTALSAKHIPRAECRLLLPPREQRLRRRQPLRPRHQATSRYSKKEPSP